MIFNSGSEKETVKIAQKLSKLVKPGDIFLIEGDLGAGKSVFVRAMAQALGVQNDMPSPTFTILNEYAGKYPVYHFDFYRINDPVELYEIGFEDYIYSDGISFIEWPSKAEGLLPDDAVKVSIKIDHDNKRVIEIEWKDQTF